MFLGNSYRSIFSWWIWYRLISGVGGILDYLDYICGFLDLLLFLVNAYDAHD